MNIIAHHTCSRCNDTWFREMDDMEITAYLAENPEAPLTQITDSEGTTQYVDLDATPCDGCEAYYQDED